jgi:hypothetical protein
VLAGVGGSATPARQAGRYPFPKPAVPIGNLPQQAVLYDAIVKEFVRLGWKTVCVEVMPGAATAPAVDPPKAVVRDLARRNAKFRPRSACRQDGEDVIDRRSGSRDGVAVTVVGADRDRDDVLIRVHWCCWVGWGTFRFVFRGGAWSLKQTEGWLQT